MRVQHDHRLLGFAVAAALASCAAPGGGGAPAPDGVRARATSGSNSFEHTSDDPRDPFDLNKQRVDLPAPSIATRLHSCQKLPYAELGALLASRGVNLKAVAPMGQPATAGQLYAAGAGALGVPNYAARTREPTQQTASGATKQMDVFIAAAPEIIQAMPGLKACQVNGQPAAMFDQKGDCTPEGVTCLMGMTAKQSYVQLCSQFAHDVADPTVGQQLAVASILAAAHTCE